MHFPRLGGRTWAAVLIAAAISFWEIIGHLGSLDFIANLLGYPDWIPVVTAFLSDPPLSLQLGLVLLILWLVLSDERKRTRKANQDTVRWAVEAATRQGAEIQQGVANIGARLDLSSEASRRLLEAMAQLARPMVARVQLEKLEELDIPQMDNPVPRDDDRPRQDFTGWLETQNLKWSGIQNKINWLCLDTIQLQNRINAAESILMADTSLVTISPDEPWRWLSTDHKRWWHIWKMRFDMLRQWRDQQVEDLRIKTDLGPGAIQQITTLLQSPEGTGAKRRP